MMYYEVAVVSGAAVAGFAVGFAFSWALGRRRARALPRHPWAIYCVD